MRSSSATNHSTGMFQRLFCSVSNAWTTSLRVPRRGPRFEKPLLPSDGVSLAALFAIVATITVLFTFHDASLTRWVLARAPEGSSLRSIFMIITYFGSSAWILILSGMLALALSVVLSDRLPFRRLMWWRGLQADATFVFWSVALSGTSASIIKNTIGRARPRHLEDLGPFAFDFGAFTSGFASFPSGHSTTFGAVCMALYLLFPRLALPLFLVALLGGGSRVVVGAHYASDVIAGLSFGAIFTLMIARWLARRGSLFDFTDKRFPQRRARR